MQKGMACRKTRRPKLYQSRRARRSVGAAKARIACVPSLVFSALLFACAVLLLPLALNAAGTVAVCDRAANLAARQTGVPVSVLKAITRTETGRGTGTANEPWPWTVNMEGKGFWFETEKEALAYVDENFKRGARSFDVGCFQINYKWHGRHFTSIDAMFDPATNALYAARFLKTLREETDSWEAAAGAYHSRTPEYAERYKARFSSYRALFLDEDKSAGRRVAAHAAPAGLPAPTPRPPRENTFPLLQSGGVTSLGSLVPITKGRGSGGLFSRAGEG